MRKSLCVGLLGGVGVGAAAHYYRELCKAAAAGGFELDLVMVNADTPRVVEYVSAGDREGLAAYLHGCVERMKAAGAVCVAIPSVTTHFAWTELKQAATLPVIDIFAAFIRAARARSVRRVALFGTRFVIESEMYGFVPEVEFVRPRAEEVQLIHATYMEVALAGQGTEEQRAVLGTLAHTLIEREGLDAVVLAGTDLALIFHPGNTDFPHLDCAALHLAAIVDAISPE